MILKIEYESGEQGLNHRKFTVEAYHMEPAADTIAPMLIHLADMLSRNPDDVWNVVPAHIPELANAVVTRSADQRDQS